jgi:hypothetical protein
MPKLITKPMDVKEYKALKVALGTDKFDSIIKKMETDKKKNIEDIFIKKKPKK